MKLTPFLLFDGICAEAMAFYHLCLGGELTITKVGDSPMKGQHPPEQQNKVVNARLISGAIDISSTDWLHPTRALLQPQFWRELLWLGRMAPRYALRAAQVLKAVPGDQPDGIFVE